VMDGRVHACSVLEGNEKSIRSCGMEMSGEETTRETSIDETILVLILEM
jgi:hypothetical protein